MTYCIVIGTFGMRTVAGVIGPFETLEEAEKLRSNHNFGPNGSKIFLITSVDDFAKMPRSKRAGGPIVSKPLGE